MPDSPRPRPHFRTIALIVGAALFMEMLDSTVLATALPSMARELGVSAPSLSIALTSYLISLAVFIPVSGRIADRFGARTVFRGAIITFIAGSILCSLANSVAFLVAARFLQGIGGALMMPVGRLILMRSVEKRDLISATSWVLIPAVIGPILGPPLGGFIVTYLNWRWIFYINVPIGVLGVVLVSIFIADSRGEVPGRTDYLGIVLSSLSLGLLLFGLELVSHDGALREASGLIAAGVLLGIIYIRHARVTPHPILDISLMKIPTYGTSVIAGAITRVCQGAHPYLLPLMMQLGFGFSAVQSGLLTFGTAIGAIVAKPVAAPLLRRFGFRDMLVVNGFFASGGYAICGLFRPGWPLPAMFVMMVLSGFFMSIQFTGYNTIAYDEIAQERMGAATSFYTTFQQLMLSVGICAGAAGLAAAMVLRGDRTPQFRDFTVAFWAVALVSLTATIWNARFSQEAGREISGHTPHPFHPPVAARVARPDVIGVLADTFAIGGALTVNRLGYGAMQITGGGVWGPPRDKAEALRVLKRLPQLGVNFIDTADSYGPDVSEQLIREALHPYDGLVIATKAGFRRSGPNMWHVDCRPEYLIAQAHESCRKLGVEQIQLWQLHRIDGRVPRRDQFMAVKQLLDDELIAHAGLSEVSVEDIIEASEYFRVATVQNAYNMADRGSDDVVDYCEANGIGFIPYYPLGGDGELARAGGPLAKLAQKKNATPGQVALAWLLKRSPVMLPIPGTSKVAHLEENMAATGLTLTDAEFASLG